MVKLEKGTYSWSQIDLKGTNGLGLENDWNWKRGKYLCVEWEIKMSSCAVFKEREQRILYLGVYAKNSRKRVSLKGGPLFPFLGCGDLIYPFWN